MKYTSDEVAAYYNEFTKIYEETSGNFIQAFRPADENVLMEYVARQLNIAPGTTLLDAGCGIGAPAIWLAKRFGDIKISCLTNSAYQFEKVQQAIRETQLEDRITVTLGDYHRLAEIYSAGSFDRVMFLESLGHSHTVEQVITGVDQVLKSAGALYIKDFFVKKSKVETVQREINEVVNVINSAYAYNVMNPAELVDVINFSGLAIEWLRKPAIESDVTITVKLEHQTQRLTYPHFMKLPAVNWYEVLAIKE